MFSNVYIRDFLWIPYDDCVLGNLNRFKRHMTTNPYCFICCSEEESTIHILRDCPTMCVVWRKVGGPASSLQFFQGNLKEWITCNISFEDETMNDKWHTFFGVSIWWIWR